MCGVLVYATAVAAAVARTLCNRPYSSLALSRACCRRYSATTALQRAVALQRYSALQPTARYDLYSEPTPVRVPELMRGVRRVQKLISAAFECWEPIYG